MCDVCLSLAQAVFKKCEELRDEGVTDKQILESLVNTTYCLSRKMGVNTPEFLELVVGYTSAGDMKDKEVHLLKQMWRKS